jgi:hypothetical protein
MEMKGWQPLVGFCRLLEGVLVELLTPAGRRLGGISACCL